MKKNLVVIAGPTASGKTELSIQLVKHFSTEIISADSRQFYKEMNVGTAKPTSIQLKEAKHHFINSLSVTQDYNAGQYETDCLLLLEKLFKKYDIVIMAGGSGMYIHAVLYGMDQLPKGDDEIRKQLKKEFEEKGIESLQKKLQQLDPEYFENVDQQNPQRLIRAIEVCLITGNKYSSLLGKKNVKRNFNFILLGLKWEKDILYKRINDRVDKMIDDGLINEVKNLLRYKEYNALQTVGYKELIQYFDGKYSLEEAIDLIKKNTRNFAKRQMTWFKKMNGMEWLDFDEPIKVSEKILTKLNSR